MSNRLKSIKKDDKKIPFSAQECKQAEKENWICQLCAHRTPTMYWNAQSWGGNIPVCDKCNLKPKNIRYILVNDGPSKPFAPFAS